MYTTEQMDRDLETAVDSFAFQVEDATLKAKERLKEINETIENSPDIPEQRKLWARAKAGIIISQALDDANNKLVSEYNG